MATPAQFKSAIDEDGNRLSILPGSARPSSQPKTKLEILRKENEEMKPSRNNERKNFVKMNMLKNYQPKMRGAAFTNKMMAKKSNNLKFKQRFAQKMKLE